MALDRAASCCAAPHAAAAAHFSRAERAAMDRALGAAARGVRGANPLVGAAVLAPDGRVAVGRHAGAGTAHAEVVALAAARTRGFDLAAATLLVTLEPCAHTGRTGPCAQAILDAGIRRVVCAAPDPTALAGGGAQRLRAAGAEVRTGLRAHEARALNARWFAARAAGRPFVTAKIAQSLDGRVAAADGTSRWITGPESRAAGHAIRARADAIAVGTGTALADNPRLSARTPDGAPAAHQPVPVLIGHRAPARDSHLADSARLLRYPSRDLAAVLADLDSRGIGHLLVEGGPRLISAFLRAGLVDELAVFIAPVLLGAGTPALPDLGIATLSGAQRWTPDPTGERLGAPERLGADTLVRLQPSPPDPPRHNHSTAPHHGED